MVALLASFTLASCGGQSSSATGLSVDSKSGESHPTGLSVDSSKTEESHPTGLSVESSEEEQSHPTGLSIDSSEAGEQSHPTGLSIDSSEEGEESHPTGLSIDSSEEEASSEEAVTSQEVVTSEEELTSEEVVYTAADVVDYINALLVADGFEEEDLLHIIADGAWYNCFYWDEGSDESEAAFEAIATECLIYFPDCMINDEMTYVYGDPASPDYYDYYGDGCIYYALILMDLDETVEANIVISIYEGWYYIDMFVYDLAA